VHLHTEGPASYTSPDQLKNFRVINIFVGHNLRRSLDYDRVDYLPCFLSEVPSLFRSKRFALDVALLHVSPPDKAGYCSLGVSVDVAKAASQAADILIAQVNPRMPRVHGDGMIHLRDFDALVDVDEALPESVPAPHSHEVDAIATHVACLVEDGSTLQMGIGAIPDAVTRQLMGRRDLGLHSEMWSDGALGLIEAGVITNAKKKVHRGKSVSGFLIGSRRLYDFVDDNPSVLQLEMDYINAPNTIARNPKVVAINSAVEIDLTGQVCADSVGHRIISGVGGQMDFMRGAALSEGGKPIIALRSTTQSGQSKVVSALQSGAGVVTTRAHVHYVVTEYGVASLHGKTLGERARALIHIAHPLHREALMREFSQTHSS
jgi:acyl-CoA hydrolase